MIPINSIYTILLYIILLAVVLLLIKHFLFSVTNISNDSISIVQSTNLDSNNGNTIKKNRNIVELFISKVHNHPSGSGHTHLTKIQAAINTRIKARLKVLSSSSTNNERKQTIVKEVVAEVTKELAKLHNLNENEQKEVVKQITALSSSKDTFKKLAETQDDPKPTKPGSKTNTDDETDLLQSISRSIQSIVSKLAMEKKLKESSKTAPVSQKQETTPPTITVNIPERTVQDDTECCGIKIFDKSLELKDINKCITQHLDEKYTEWKKADDVECKTPHNILSKTSNCGGNDKDKGIIAKYYKNWKFLYKISDFNECKYKYDIENEKTPDKECSYRDKLDIMKAKIPCEKRDPPLKSIGNTAIKCIGGQVFSVFKCGDSTKVKCNS